MAFLERPFFDAEASAFPHMWNYQGANCRSGRQRRSQHFGFASLSCADSVLAFFQSLRIKKRWARVVGRGKGPYQPPARGAVPGP